MTTPKQVFSNTEERKAKAKAEDEMKAERAFVPDSKDYARLLPRLREAVRR